MAAHNVGCMLAYGKVDYCNYKARKLIGRGSYGDVILCERRRGCSPKNSNSNKKEERDEFLVALKRVRRAKSGDSEQKVIEKSIKREAKILKDLSHPYIVESLFAIKETEFIYLGLEYCSGGDLFTLFCHDLPMTKLQATKYLIQISLALEYIHQRNIIHRDIKPENVVLKDGCCKLIDFGNAHVLKNQNDSIITKSGTMPYTAPEILERRQHRCEVDWFSLGVLACEMLTFTSPFGNTDHMSSEQLCEAICQNPPIISNDVDKITQDLLEGLMCKQQEQRLGYNGLVQLQRHPFFKNVQWNLEQT